MHHRIASRPAARVALLAAAVAVLLTSVPVHAASSVQIDARPLLGGRYEVGGWAAIAVTLVNDGPPTEGHLSAETRSGVMSRFVEMPAGARKVVTLYVQPEAFQRRITVRYEEPNGTVESVVEVRVMERTSGQLAIVGDGGGTLRPQVLGPGEEGRPEPLTLPLADIPERPEPLGGIAGMIWAADSTGLTDAQQRSLERWVADGGQLVVIGGGDWQSRTDRFADILPLDELAAVDGTPQATLAAWAGVDAPPVEEATVVTGELHPDGRVLISDDAGTALVSMRPIGAGRVVLVGSDFATDAHRGWTGAPAFWSRLMPSTTAFEHFWGGFPIREEAENAMSQALGNVPSLAVPPAELLLAVIVGYILLIGPISYIVLRRLDRRELAWVTAPLLVVMFTACSYGIGSTMKGGEVVVNQISLIRSSGAGGTALVQAYAGIFSPERDTFDLTVEADALMGQLRPSNMPNGRQATASVVAEQGDPARLRGLSIGVFGFEGVRADAIVPHRPALTVSWSADEDGDLVGTVTNVSDEAILDVAYISPSAGKRLGDLEPGASGTITIPRRNLNGSSASDQVYGFAGFDGGNERAGTVMLRRQVIDSLVGYGGFMPGFEGGGLSGRGPYLIGWRADAGPLTIDVEDLSAQRLSQSVEVIGVRPAITAGELTIEPGRMSVVTRDLEGDAHNAGPGMVGLADGAVTFSIALPLEASGMAVTDVEIVIGPDPGMVLDPGGFGGGFWPPGYAAELRDSRTGEWRPLGDLAQESRFTIDDPSAAISAAGRIEVRVRAENGNPNFGPSTVFASARVSGVIDE